MQYVIRPKTDDRVCILHSGMSGNKHPLGKDELMHYRTKGSRNGVRLYQNEDGSLTPLGRRHYGVEHTLEWIQAHGARSKEDAMRLAKAKGREMSQQTAAVQTPKVKETPKPTAAAAKKITFNASPNTPNSTATEAMKNAQREANRQAQQQTTPQPAPTQPQATPKPAPTQQQTTQRGPNPNKPTGPVLLTAGAGASDVGPRGTREMHDSLYNTPAEETKNAQKAPPQRVADPGQQARQAAQGSLYNLNGTKKDVPASQSTIGERVGKAIDTGVGAAKKAADNVAGAVSGAGQAIGNAAKDVGQYAGGVVNGLTHPQPQFPSGSPREAEQQQMIANTDPDTLNGQRVGSGIRDAWNGVTGAVSGAARNVGDFAQNNIINPVTGAVQNVGQYAGGVVNGLTHPQPQFPSGSPREAEQQQMIANTDPDTLNGQRAGGGIRDFFGNLWNGVTGAANSVGQGIGNAVNGAGQWIGNAANDVGQWVGNAANDVGQYAGGLWNGLTNQQPQFQSGSPREAEQQQMIANTDQDVLNGQRAGGGIRDFFGNVWNGVTGAVNGAGQWIGNAANDVGQYAGGLWNGLTNPRSDQQRENLSNAPVGMVDADTVNGQRAGNDIRNFFGNIGQGVTGAVNGAGQWIGDNVVQPTQGFVQGFANTMGGNNGQNYRAMRDSNFDPDVVKGLQNGSNFANGIIGTANAIGKGVTGAVNGAVQGVGNAAKDVGQYAGGLWNGLTRPQPQFPSGSPRESEQQQMIANTDRDVLNGQRAGNDIRNFVGNLGQGAANLWNGATGAVGRAGQGIASAAKQGVDAVRNLPNTIERAKLDYRYPNGIPAYSPNQTSNLTSEYDPNYESRNANIVNSINEAGKSRTRLEVRRVLYNLGYPKAYVDQLPDDRLMSLFGRK